MLWVRFLLIQTCKQLFIHSTIALNCAFSLMQTFIATMGNACEYYVQSTHKSDTQYAHPDVYPLSTKTKK
jgi:hypothetical protein